MPDDVAVPDLQSMAMALLADIMCLDPRQGDEPCDECFVRAEAILCDPDVQVGKGVIDVEMSTGRHAAVVVWLPLWLSARHAREARS